MKVQLTWIRLKVIGCTRNCSISKKVHPWEIFSLRISKLSNKENLLWGVTISKNLSLPTIFFFDLCNEHCSWSVLRELRHCKVYNEWESYQKLEVQAEQFQNSEHFWKTSWTSWKHLQEEAEHLWSVRTFESNENSKIQSFISKTIQKRPPKILKLTKAILLLQISEYLLIDQFLRLMITTRPPFEFRDSVSSCLHHSFCRFCRFIVSAVSLLRNAVPVAWLFSAMFAPKLGSNQNCTKILAIIEPIIAKFERTLLRNSLLCGRLGALRIGQEFSSQFQCLNFRLLKRSKQRLRRSFCVHSTSALHRLPLAPQSAGLQCRRCANH